MIRLNNCLYKQHPMLWQLLYTHRHAKASLATDQPYQDPRIILRAAPSGPKKESNMFQAAPCRSSQCKLAKEIAIDYFTIPSI